MSIVNDIIKPRALIPTDDFRLYKNTVKKMYKEYELCEDPAMKESQHRAIMKQFLQPEILKEQSVEWLIVWKGHIMYHKIMANTDANKEYYRGIVDSLDDILENEGYYDVSAEQFMDAFRNITKAIYSRGVTPHSIPFIVALLDYINKTINGVWHNLDKDNSDNENRITILIQIMIWEAYWSCLKDKCNKIQAKYSELLGID